MDAQWLQKQFEEQPGKSKADLARVLGLEPPAISKILGGGRQIKAQEYHLMRQFFGLPVDGHPALSPSAPSVPAPQGMAEKISQHGLDGMAALPRRLDNPVVPVSEKLRVFRVEDDAMQPDYKPGDHILADTSRKDVEQGGAFILCDGYSYMIRDCVYATGTAQGKIRISGRKPDFQSQTLSPSDFLIIGRVVGKVQWV